MSARYRISPSWMRLATAGMVALLSSVPVAAQRAVPHNQPGEPSSAPSGERQGERQKVASESPQPSGGDKSAREGRNDGSTPRTVQRRPAADGGSRTTGGGRTAAPREREKSREGSGGNTAEAGTPVDRSDVPSYSRPRGNNPVTGQAVARRGRPPVNGGDGDNVWAPGGYYGGYYPWGYGGLGLGGYYGGYYDPWYYGQGGYYPAYDDYDGRVRLKVKPTAAEVFVDGYYAGIVDEFDGIFQRLHIEPGPHRIEVREEGFEPLTFEVFIQPDKTITYEGELRRIQ
jgi:hypothetical protein